MSGSVRHLIYIVAAIIVLSAVSVAVALIATSDEAERYEAGSPEFAVQGYIQAVRDRDVDEAYEMLSSSAKRDVSRSEMRDYVRYSYMQDADWRIRLTGSNVTGERATVELTVEYRGGGPLDLNRYTRKETVPLVREDGEWKIDEPYIGW
jgi:type II secretory pathway component PulL